MNLFSSMHHSHSSRNKLNPSSNNHHATYLVSLRKTPASFQSLTHQTSSIARVRADLWWHKSHRSIQATTSMYFHKWVRVWARNRYRREITTKLIWSSWLKCSRKVLNLIRTKCSPRKSRLFLMYQITPTKMWTHSLQWALIWEELATTFWEYPPSPTKKVITMEVLQPRSHLLSSLSHTSSINGISIRIFLLRDSTTEHSRNYFHHTVQVIRRIRTSLELREAHNHLISQQWSVAATFRIEHQLIRVI